jgi:hypothetical protein
MKRFDLFAVRLAIGRCKRHREAQRFLTYSLQPTAYSLSASGPQAL